MHVMVPGRVFIHLSHNLSWILTETWGGLGLFCEKCGGWDILLRGWDGGWGGGKKEIISVQCN